MQKTTHWPSILILGVVIPGALLFLLAALGFGISSIVGLVTDGEDPAGGMIASLSTGFEGILLACIAWFIVQKSSGRTQADQPFKLPFSSWHILVAVALGAVALLLGTAVSFSGIKFLTWLVLPLLTLLLIVPPIWVLLGLGTSKLDFGPRWRTLGIFGLGMTLGPLIMIVLEFLLLLVVVIVVALIILQEPGKIDELTQLASAIQTETDPQALLEMLAPYLFNPSILKLAIGFIAFGVPMIEELFKPLGVWLFARQIERPAQGFSLGLLSGAAYALVESLGASGRGDTSWAVVVAVRAGTSLLHIMTTGLMGWAIVAAFRERRFGRLLATYLTVVLIHGIWNAAAVGAGLAVTSDVLRNTSWSVSILPAALLIGMLVLLFVSNQRVRKSLANEEIPASQEQTPLEATERTEGVK